MSGKKPRFSVIIPARNEEAYLEETIRAVKAQDYPDTFEIIVVNNSSVDETAAIAERLGATVINEARVGLPRARESGRQAARGEIIVYVDADTHLPKNYLSTLDTVFQSQPQTIATSNPFTFFDGTPLHQSVIRFFFGVIYPFQNFLLILMGKSHQVLGGNFAVRSETLEEIGGFDTSIIFYGEDLALSKELAKRGTITILPKLYSQTSARRFRAHGTIKTISVYIKNFFAVLFFNKESDGTAIKKILQVGLFFVAVVLTVKYIHLGRVLFRRRKRTAEYLGGILAAITAYGIFYPKSVLFGPVISHFNTSEPIIALTFDDGPNGAVTEKVLDILKAENVPASFFLIGKNVKAQPDMVKRIQAAGHDIGNHSDTHRWLLPFFPTPRIADEIEKTQAKLGRVLGETKGKKLFRPPHGWRTPWMLGELRRHGYQVITWDVSLDFVPGVSAKAIKRRYVRKTEPGSILLFHDAIWNKPMDTRENMLEALPHIIHKLKKRGYRFVRISEML